MGHGIVPPKFYGARHVPTKPNFPNPGEFNIEIQMKIDNQKTNMGHGAP